MQVPDAFQIRWTDPAPESARVFRREAQPRRCATGLVCILTFRLAVARELPGFTPIYDAALHLGRVEVLGPRVFPEPAPAAVRNPQCRGV